MNLLQIINDLKQIAAECDKVTSGNVSHKIANIEQGILNITYYLEHYCELGWHPASDPPIVPENHNWISVVAIVLDMDDNSTRATNATFNKDKGWIFPEFSKVLCWSYPPEGY